MKFVLTHSYLAALMMLCIGFPLTILSVENAEWIAATWSIAFYYSREHNQFQTALAKERGVPRSSLWYRGWWPGEWPTWRQRMQFLMPAMICVVIALFVGG